MKHVFNVSLLTALCVGFFRHLLVLVVAVSDKFRDCVLGQNCIRVEGGVLRIEPTIAIGRLILEGEVHPSQGRRLANSGDLVSDADGFGCVGCKSEF